MEAFKNLSRKQRIILIVAGAIIVLVTLGAANRVKAPAPVQIPEATSTEPVATTTAGTTATSTTPMVVYTGPFPINSADHIASWDFKGAYSGNVTLTDQATADITKLTGLLGKGTYDDYDLYDGVANDYTAIGNGHEAYQYYDRAIKTHPGQGLAYVNLAHLFDVMGAYYTAADAYAKAVTVEPGMLQYHIQRLEFLTTRFPDDTARITTAFQDAYAHFGDTAQTLSIKAQWLTEQGNDADAIKAWQTVKALSPGQDTSAIDAEIARLEAKQ